jgi:PadR family transcriptional regulator PadR
MSIDQPRLTAPTLKVLGAFLSNAHAELSGADICRSTSLASGTLYPILLRLEAAKWLTSQWEQETAEKLGRPRRRLYELTGLGARSAKKAFNELTTHVGGIAWNTY